MRFSMYHAEGRHPVLAFCNAGSKIFFWDVERLTSYHEFVTAATDPVRDRSVPTTRPAWLMPIRHRKEKDAVSKLRGGGGGGGGSDAESLASGHTGRGGETGTPDPEKKVGGTGASANSDGTTAHELSAEYSAETVATWEGRYSMEDPHEMLKPHKTEQFSSASFVGRQVAWSPEGEWCVVVGSRNLALILQRWDKDEPQDMRAAVGEAAK